MARQKYKQHYKYFTFYSNTENNWLKLETTHFVLDFERVLSSGNFLIQITLQRTVVSNAKFLEINLQIRIG